MSDFPYSKWGDFIISQIDASETTLEMACGTGNLTIELFKRGIKIHGLDLDRQMLTMANNKATEQGLDITFYLQNMLNADLEGYSNVICPCDGINSLLSDSQLNRFFENISTQLKGKFIFDFSTKSKLKKMTAQTSYEDYEDITYFWKTRYIETRDIASLELAFFEKNKLGYYNRDDVYIRQRGLTIEYIEGLLSKHEFLIEGIYDDYTFQKPTNESQRVVFVCSKE